MVRAMGKTYTFTLSLLKVNAFSVDRGQLLGSWHAHDDAVCCTSVVGDGSAFRLLTASWDCSVKVCGLGHWVRM